MDGSQNIILINHLILLLKTLKIIYMKSKILVCGAGGFIGSHFVSRLLTNNNLEIVCADIKPIDDWFQAFSECKNFSFDLKSYDNCLKATDGVDYIYNFACNMGGMGFIENNKAECMLSVLINTNLLRASVENNVSKYLFSSSACVYNAQKQKETFVPGLKESDAYPAMPEDGYGWEKFLVRECADISKKIMALKLGLLDIIMFMVPWELSMEVEKKLQQQFAEK